MAARVAMWSQPRVLFLQGTCVWGHSSAVWAAACLATTVAWHAWHVVFSWSQWRVRCSSSISAQPLCGGRACVSFFAMVFFWVRARARASGVGVERERSGSGAGAERWARARARASGSGAVGVCACACAC
eukprot:3789872-Rhodomonas_salina.1